MKTDPDPVIETLITALLCIADDPTRFSTSFIISATRMAADEIRGRQPVAAGPPETSCPDQTSIYDIPEAWTS